MWSRVPHDELAPLYAAVRAKPGLVAAVLAAAAAAWAWTARAAQGMGGGPWTALGGLGAFVGVWLVMMAAMMVPSVAPTVALYARVVRGRSTLLPVLFGAGYLAVWVVAGLAAVALGDTASALLGARLTSGGLGQALAGDVLVVAALYELTPVKDRCLGVCRVPLHGLLSPAPDSRARALRRGVWAGAWCVGCCWALMAALFALGAMSLAWMAMVAGIVAAQKVLPWRRAASLGTAVVLLALAVLVFAAPDLVPGWAAPVGGPMPMR
jgi:predicted metal-binding membrane protein